MFVLRSCSQSMFLTLVKHKKSLRNEIQLHTACAAYFVTYTGRISQAASREPKKHTELVPWAVASARIPN